MRIGVSNVLLVEGRYEGVEKMEDELLDLSELVEAEATLERSVGREAIFRSVFRMRSSSEVFQASNPLDSSMANKTQKEGTFIRDNCARLTGGHARFTRREACVSVAHVRKCRAGLDSNSGRNAAMAAVPPSKSCELGVDMVCLAHFSCFIHLRRVLPKKPAGKAGKLLGVDGKLVWRISRPWIVSQ